ncbi:MAG: hypothetical protein ACRD0P_17240, partial [Stackebrandtia sp.]
MPHVMQLLWICGPPGIGKTTTAWELYSRLITDGTPTGFVDIDQLGMSFPEPQDDPGRYRMKERNLGEVARGFGAAGARCVVVSGVADPVNGTAGDLERLAPADVTLCRLRSDREELRARYIERGARLEVVEAALAEADALDRSDFADKCVDTTGAAVSEVLRRMGERLGDWPVIDSPHSSAVRGPAPNLISGPSQGSGPILWLCGPAGVGKSSVGWEIYQRVLGSGVPAAFVDLDQLGFLRPSKPDDRNGHRLKAGNAAALWNTFRAAGARCMIMVGPVDGHRDVSTYVDALPKATVTLIRLHAGRTDLERRISLRARGHGPSLPGDELPGKSPEYLRGLADRAARVAQRLERERVGDLYVATDGRTISQVA